MSLGVGGWVALGVGGAAGVAPSVGGLVVSATLAQSGVDAAGLAPPAALGVDVAGVAPATLTIGVTGALSDVAPIQVANTAAGLDLIKFFLARGWLSLFSSKISSMVLK